MADRALMEKINALPDAMKIEVEHFVEFLLTKQSPVSPANDDGQKNTVKQMF
ncbi:MULTISPECIES: DUF2281 domain-containing protein [Synechocystis]|uniref:DUF2281 domain-containing protein n=1 Tax=Synechocystis TaxID=1142 RepID=UPI001D149EAC|nr:MULTISPECIES: DUF2281 domain-containing protein [Synechocystis]